MKFLKKQIVSDSFLPVREALISSIHDLSRKSCCQRRFHRVAIKYISKCTVSCSTVCFEYLNKITCFVVIIVCLQTRPVKVKTQTKTNIWCKITVFIIAIEINFHAVCAFEVIFNSCYWYFIRSWITTGVLHWHQIPVFFILMFEWCQWRQMVTNSDTATLLICVLHTLWIIPSLLACWQTFGSTDCTQTHKHFFLVSFRMHSNYFSKWCWPIGLHKQDTACYLRGRNRLFKYSLP